MSLSPQLEALVSPLLKGHANHQRRKTLPRSVGIAVVLLTAAALGAVALAASNSWIFKEDHGFALGKTTVLLHGTTYTVETYVSADGRSFNIGLSQGKQTLVDSVGRSWLRAPGVAADPRFPNPPPPSGAAIYGNRYTSEGGEIWFGISRPDIARVDLTDQHGGVFSTATVQPPRKYKSAFRFWVIAVPSSHATSYTAYDFDGTSIQRSPLSATTIMSLY